MLLPLLINLEGAGGTLPTVDAGGPYEGKRFVEAILDATVTPGSDASPTYAWTITEGGDGTFEDNTVLDVVFTPETAGPYTLLLTVSTTDTNDVTDEATFTVLSGGGGVSQRRLQMIKKDDEEVIAMILWLRSRGIDL